MSLGFIQHSGPSPEELLAEHFGDKEDQDRAANASAQQ
jgi:hypothetical protein